MAANNCFTADNNERVLPFGPNPPNRHARQSVGVAQFRPRMDRAVTEWQKAVEIAPWWAQAYLNLGTALQKADRPIEAAQALRADPHPANGQNVRMEIYKLEYETKGTQVILPDAERGLKVGCK